MQKQSLKIFNRFEEHNEKKIDFILCAWNVFLEHYNESSEKMDELLDGVQEAGFNTIGIKWVTNLNSLEKILKKLQKRNLYLIIKGAPKIKSDDEGAFAEWFDTLSKSPVFIGFMLSDEPSAVKFKELKEVKDAYTKYFSNPKDPFVVCNLYPNYASHEQLGVSPSSNIPDELQKFSGVDTNAYLQHLKDYVDIFEPELLSYDHYPLTFSLREKTLGSEKYIYKYFANLSNISTISKSASIPFFSAIQAWGFCDIFVSPTVREYSWMMNTCYAFGVSGLIAFSYRNLYPEGGGSEAWKECPITIDGDKTKTYDVISKSQHEFKEITDKCKEFTHKKTFTYNCPNYINKAINQQIELHELSIISNIGGEGSVVIGYMEKENKIALFFANAMIYDKAQITVTLKEKSKITINERYSKITSSISNTFTLNIDKGKAILVLIE